MNKRFFVCIAILTFAAGGCVGSKQPSPQTASTASTAAAKAPPTTVRLTRKEVFRLGARGTVQLFGRQGENIVGGTGVVFDAARGLVVTNSHVVAGVVGLQARFRQENPIPAQVLGTAPCDDVAVVRLTDVPAGIRSIRFGNSSTVEHEDEVVALGYPASFADFATQDVVSTNGTVQSPRVAATPDPSLPRYPSTIQHSATINHGNSGGPLLNDRGQLIGINTLTNEGTEQQRVQGQYYAISINHIKPLLPRLVAGRSVANAGWDLVPLSEMSFEALYPEVGLGTPADGRVVDQYLSQQGIRGLYVIGVDADSPAAKANVVVGDGITGMQGTPVTTVPEVCDILQSSAPRTTLQLEGMYLTDAAQYQEKLGAPWTSKIRLSG
jgi:S1-C subfamily serine protease